MVHSFIAFPKFRGPKIDLNMVGLMLPFSRLGVPQLQGFVLRVYRRLQVARTVCTGSSWAHSSRSKDTQERDPQFRETAVYLIRIDPFPLILKAPQYSNPPAQIQNFLNTCLKGTNTYHNLKLLTQTDLPKFIRIRTTV